MARAIALAEQGMKKGDGGPFGAVIVKNDIVIGEGWNQVLATNDPTAHAEIVAIRAACTHSNSYWLSGCNIFISCEPCPMCLAAIYWSRMSSITFAATREDAAEIGFDDAHIYKEIALPMTNRVIRSRQIAREASIKIMRLWPELDGKKDY